MAKINTRITLIDAEGEPQKLQVYEEYIWLPKGTKVKHDNKEYTVEEYRLNVNKNIIDIIVK